MNFYFLISNSSVLRNCKQDIFNCIFQTEGTENPKITHPSERNSLDDSESDEAIRIINLGVDLI